MYTHCIVQRPYGLLFSGKNSQDLYLLLTCVYVQKIVLICTHNVSYSDHMDSYFLAETVKYLYLLFDDSAWTQDFRGVLQCVAVCCSVLQCVAVCCSVLHEVFSYCVCLFRRPFVDAGFQRRVAVCCRVSQCIALWCSVLQCVA